MVYVSLLKNDAAHNLHNASKRLKKRLKWHNRPRGNENIFGKLSVKVIVSTGHWSLTYDEVVNLVYLVFIRAYWLNRFKPSLASHIYLHTDIIVIIKLWLS